MNKTKRILKRKSEYDRLNSRFQLINPKYMSFQEFVISERLRDVDFSLTILILISLFSVATLIAIAAAGG